MTTNETREIKNAKITNTSLGYEDHGVLTAWLQLDYGGSGQGFGGYVFDRPIKDSSGVFLYREPTAYGLKFIAKILEAVGADSWEKLKGKHIRVECSFSRVYRVGHLLKDIWFDPDELVVEPFKDFQNTPTIKFKTSPIVNTPPEFEEVFKDNFWDIVDGGSNE